MNDRTIAAKILYDVLGAQIPLDKSLSKQLNSLSNAQSKGFIQEICYGVMRWYSQLDFYANQLIKVPLKKQDQDIFALVLIGLYQLLYMNVPDYAAIGETVEAARELKKVWAVKLINAVLRNFTRKKELLLKQIEKNESAKYSHPDWLVKKIKHAWPNDWQHVLETNNQHPPMSLRVNQQLTDRDDYIKKLQEKNITAKADDLVESCIILEKPCGVAELPGFSEGMVSVQDCSAQLAAELLDVQPNQRVLDACAAPGGKTMHILEGQSDLKQLVAVDNAEQRIKLIQENLDRAALSAKLICADVSDTKSWWDGALFDRILLDVPCSSIGVIRRHPDIKIMRRETDIKKLAEQQLKMLKSLWPLLKPNGILLYVTCSILPEENNRVVKAFLNKQKDASEIKVEAKWGIACEIGRQILPQENRDGFYYAKLTKK